jgi:hypothetical protein
MDIFLKRSGLSQLRFCGLFNNVVTVSLIKNSENGRPLKFGEGWKGFCELNNIVAGNEIHFEASDDTDYSHILRVQVV